MFSIGLEFVRLGIPRLGNYMSSCWDPSISINIWGHWNELGAIGMGWGHWNGSGSIGMHWGQLEWICTQHMKASSDLCDDLS